ncbi:FecR family protein [Pedobacter alluvionis]|uniref:DUF4974 domain-containing protein n=1 Tax=Pedobacter alluvionis TaxID=475253 RepID=A0A497XYE1_9SPHI|nr:FecR family protein [Pedobacter alluvionis]RLJ75141.1 FecR family protein [Pedobacter alluvionis]TFB30245.1 DUF4974 domain-containing protein [Pedobacter alluvionis]
MENTDPLQLIEKYRDNKCSPEEVEQLLAYFHKDSPEQEQIMELVLAELQQEPSAQELKSNNIQNTIDQAYLNIRKEIAYSGVSRPKRTRQLWARMVGAAMILIIAGVSYLYFLNADKKVNETQSIADVKPGHTAATLTLATGKKILLNDASVGAIASEKGIEVSKTKDGKVVYTIKGSNAGSNTNLNTLSTAKGETYQIVLLDGTKVWLNAATTLTYPANMRGSNERVVRVDGEAYFEVAKDKRHPFIVESATQRVKVLGTHFNINSYLDEEKTITTLAEGVVEVSTVKRSSEPDKKTLKPGQQSIAEGSKIEVQEADLQTTLAWKDGKLYFKDASIQEVLRQVSRWYNIEVEYRGTPTKELFSGGIKRTANLSSVLRILELSKVYSTLTKRNNITTLIIL